ncbi:MAG TPA: sigma factor G inhibitor Gin [Bacillota bacterium]|nr:sigma factor G inhibitor Gin [Bacillota bacterium]
MEETECAFCGQREQDALIFLGRRICSFCERRLTRLKADDPDYSIWLGTLRQIWEDWYRVTES